MCDYKGQFQLGNHRYCYLLTITDYRSRYLLTCEGLEPTREAGAFPVFEHAFREFGLPAAIRTDPCHIPPLSQGSPQRGPCFRLQSPCVGGLEKKAQGILSEYREQLNFLAQALSQKEIPEADEIQELIDGGSEQSRTVAGAGQ